APVSRRQIAVGKLIAAASLWAAAFAITVPYVWFLGRGVGIVSVALWTGIVVGSLLAVTLISLGLVISTFTASNRVSLSVSLFLLLALFAPTQLPSSAPQGRAGLPLRWITRPPAGEPYVRKILTTAHGWHQDLPWLIPPAIAAVLSTAIALGVAAPLIRLRGGVSKRGLLSCRPSPPRSS